MLKKDEVGLHLDEAYARTIQQSEFNYVAMEWGSFATDANLARRLTDWSVVQGAGPHKWPPPEPKGPWGSVRSSNRFAVQANFLLLYPVAGR